jgi:hypothetical protein
MSMYLCEFHAKLFDSYIPANYSIPPLSVVIEFGYDFLGLVLVPDKTDERLFRDRCSRPQLCLFR